MQSDDVIWEVINKNFCSFKVEFNKTKFCRNVYNVTGNCNKVSCPLANSRYATIREEEGVCYLYIKTVERAHTPAKMWEKIKLDKNFAKSIEIIDSNLEFWPGHMIHRVKQRYIRIFQYLIRMRKMRKQVRRELVPIKSRSEKRDSARESKAVIAAKLTVNIKKELLDRLNKNTYGDLYYYPEEILQSVMDEHGIADENLEHEDIEDEDENVEYVEGESEDEDEDELEYENENENDNDLEDFEENEDDDDEEDFEDDDDDEEYIQQNNSKKRNISTKKIGGAAARKPRIEIVYEEETEPTTNTRQTNRQ